MSHVIHENVEEYRTEDLNPLVPCLIPYSASLRYVFMILPLFLVLLPEASSCNMTEIRKDYDNILVSLIIHLERLISQKIISSCNQNPTKCYFLPENTTITSLTSCLKIEANCTGITSALKSIMENVLNLTLQILNKNYCTLQPLNHSRYRQECKKIIRKSDCTQTFCCLKNIVSALSSWWKKFLYHDYPQRE